MKSRKNKTFKSLKEKQMEENGKKDVRRKR